MILLCFESVQQEVLINNQSFLIWFLKVAKNPKIVKTKNLKTRENWNLNCLFAKYLVLMFQCCKISHDFQTAITTFKIIGFLY